MTLNKAKRNLLILFLIAFVDQAAFGVILPFLTTVFTNVGVELYIFNSIPKYEHISLILLGVTFSLYPLAQFFASPLLGTISDFYGRKRVLLFSLSVMACSYVFLYLGVLHASMIMIFLGRVCGGIAAGSIAVIFAMIADMSNEEDVSKNIGIIAAASGLGLVLGPALGIFMTDDTSASPEPLLLFVVFISATLVITTTFLQEDRLSANLKRYSFKKIFLNIFSKKNSKIVNKVLLLSFLFAWALALFVTFSTVQLVDKYDLSQKDLSMFMAYFGICLVLVQIILVPFVSRIFPVTRIILWSLALASMSLFGFALSSNIYLICVLTPLVAIGIGLTYTNILTLLDMSAHVSERGEIQGINMSLLAAAQFLSALVAGFIALFFNTGTPMIIASVILLIACIYTGSLLRRNII